MESVVGWYLLAGVLDVVQGSAGVEHGAAGHTNGTAAAAGDVGVSEGGTAGDKLVHVGSVDVGITQSVDGVETLVIGEEE